MDSTKYGDDMMFESWADNYIFFPIGDKMMPFLKKLKFTPNKITLLSTISTLVSCYYLYNYNIKRFTIFYILGYLLDCIDGRFARKYKMSSLLGMVADSTSDCITNFIIVIILFLKYRNYKNFNIVFIIILYLTHKLSISYGLNEAIASYNNTKNDDFYNYKKDMLKGFETNILKKVLKNIYLMVHYTSYKSYKMEFSKYDIHSQNEFINKSLKDNKEFGPGNFTIFIALVLNFILV